MIRILNSSQLEEAAEYLRNGELVAIPTETVYGLGANAMCEEAVRKIYEVKGRPSDNPLIIHVAGADEVERYCSEIPEAAVRVMERFWPGPVTMVLKKKDNIGDFISAGLPTVAVRCPLTQLTRDLIRLCGFPIAAPSANLSGRPSTTTVAHCVEDLDGKIPAVLDGGDCRYGLESTIIDLSEDVPTLLRPGAVTLEELRDLLGEVRVDKALTQALAPGERPKAPGMKYRHYAPAAPLTLVSGAPEDTAEYIGQFTDPETGVLCFDDLKDRFGGAGAVLTYGNSLDREEQAHELFDRLREFDKTEVKQIYAQVTGDEGIGLAIVNRLSKAAGFHIVRV